MTLIQYWKDKPLYILIDALDECASYGPFLHKLASTDWGKLRVQFILSSRALEDIETPLKLMPVDTIRIINMNKEASIGQDIIQFVEKQLTTSKFERLQEFQVEIVSTLRGESLQYLPALAAKF